MILLDAPAFRPLGAPDDDWARLMATQYPAGTIVIPDEESRYGWLKKLRTETILGKFTLLTTPESMLFWSLLPEVVKVETHHGKAMPKGMRQPDIQSWARVNAAGTYRKGELKKLLAQKQVLREWGQLSFEYQQARIPDVSINDEGGTYINVTQDMFPAVTLMLVDHVSSGGWWSWDSETETSGEDDTEAPNPYTSELVSFSISIKSGEAWNFPLRHRDPDTDTLQPENLKPAATELILLLYEMMDLGSRVVMWNAKYDYSVFCNPVNACIGANTVYQKWLPVTEDGMLMAQTANQLRASLKWNAETELGAEVIDYKKLTGGKSFAYVEPNKARVYAGKDADWTLQLYPILKARLEELSPGSLQLYEEEIPLIEFFMRMERRGMRVDREQVDTALAGLEKDLAWGAELVRISLEAEGVDVPDDFNVNSRDQVAQLMYSPKPRGLGLPVLQRTSSGSRGSVDKKTRNKLRAAGIESRPFYYYQAYTEAAQNFTHYFGPVPRYIQQDGRIRPSFSQAAARSGRTSAKDPPVQTFPKALRKAVIPEPGGSLLAFDWEQMELRWMAIEYGEENMLSVFRTGGDIHNDTLVRVGLPDRTRAKNFNFGAGYGAGPTTLADTGGIPVEQAAKFLEAYWLSYPTLRRGMDQKIHEGRETGQALTWRGRVRVLGETWSDEAQAENDRLCMNHPIQGGCLDIAKIAMARMLPLVRLAERANIYPINFMHDEFDFERGPECGDLEWTAFKREVEEIMVGANPKRDVLEMPVAWSESTENWAGCK